MTGKRSPAKQGNTTNNKREGAETKKKKLLDWPIVCGFRQKKKTLCYRALVPLSSTPNTTLKL